jgi:hypothetical protein
VDGAVGRDRLSNQHSNSTHLSSGEDGRSPGAVCPSEQQQRVRQCLHPLRS